MCWTKRLAILPASPAESTKRSMQTFSGPLSILASQPSRSPIRGTPCPVFQQPRSATMTKNIQPKVLLTQEEQQLLDWLSLEEYSQYGECHGSALSSLIAKGLAQLHSPGEHQVFIANDHLGVKGIMYQAVSLTEKGRARKNGRD